MDNTRRFINREEDYVKYRPHYPVEIIGYLQHAYGLDPGKQIADIGAGTGISSALFLDAGYPVVAVEPNKEMREKSQQLLGDSPGFRAVDGTAEDPNLSPASIDAIISGQAFHWFDHQKARAAFKKILRKNGIVVLMWNERQRGSAFEEEYDQLIIKHGRDYVDVGHRNIGMGNINDFYSPAPVELKTFANKQLFDFTGLQGRLLSSSYMPAKGQDGFDGMIADLQALFDKFKENNQVTINYITRVYSGML